MSGWFSPIGGGHLPGFLSNRSCSDDYWVTVDSSMAEIPTSWLDGTSFTDWYTVVLGVSPMTVWYSSTNVSAMIHSLRPHAKFHTIPCSCYLAGDHTSPCRHSPGWELFWQSSFPFFNPSLASTRPIHMSTLNQNPLAGLSKILFVFHTCSGIMSTHGSHWLHLVHHVLPFHLSISLFNPLLCPSASRASFFTDSITEIMLTLHLLSAYTSLTVHWAGFTPLYQSQRGISDSGSPVVYYCPASQWPSRYRPISGECLSKEWTDSLIQQGLC